MKYYPLKEGVEFLFVCPGCGSRHKTNIPKHGAPYVWRCSQEWERTDGLGKTPCGWTVTMQSDAAGLSVGYTAPLRKRPELRLVTTEEDTNGHRKTQG